jgi:kynureninase
VPAHRRLRGRAAAAADGQALQATAARSLLARTRHIDRLTAEAAALDAADPLAHWRDEFVVDDPDLVYLDGNSLGRLPHAVRAAIARTVEDEWGRGLIRSWDRWVDVATRVGDRIGTTLLGADPGETIAGESTTVNLYKALAAACADRSGPIVCDRREFPTDRFVAGSLREVVPDLVDGAAVVLRSVVDYRTGELQDVAAVSAEAHAAGALAVWDCSHAVGVIPLALRADGADLAVGCTYKHLCAGPGAPAWLWVRREHHERLRSPIAGWWAQADRFSMDAPWSPMPGIAGWASGTPDVIGLAAVDAAVEVVAGAGIDAIRAKSTALVAFARDVADALGLELASPRDPARCGAHVAVRHQHAPAIVLALRDRKVIPDLRPPDVVRIGLSPLTTRFRDVSAGLAAMREVIDTGAWHAFEGIRPEVT